MENSMTMQSYGVYISVDDAGRVTAINSSAFLADTDGWTRIDEGLGDKYHHAQGNYLPLPLRDERGICRYLWDGQQVVERTKEAMDADYVEPAPGPDLAAEVAALRDSNRQLQEALELLLSGATEEVAGRG